MTTLSTSEVPISDKNYCNIVINIFQGYTNDNLEGKPFWESIKIDFKDWTKKYQNAINSKTQSIIKAFQLLYGVWINDYKSQSSRSKILIKLVLATKYDTKLKDWDMNYIKDIARIYSKVSRDIVLWLHYLQGDELKEI